MPVTCSRGCCPTQRDHYLSISIAAAATPTRRPQATEVGSREARWDRDMPAYRRLRANGMQPRHIDGCAELEAKAASPTDIEWGLTNIPAAKRPEVEAAAEMEREMAARPSAPPKDGVPV